NDDALYWVAPNERCIIPLHGLRISRKLARQVRNTRLHFTINRDFLSMVRLCCKRDKTWINAPLLELYGDLHRHGFAHSIEIYESPACTHCLGGLFGVTLRGAFFGESMVSLAPNISKLALIALVACLQKQQFTLLDCQFPTPHLLSLGGQVMTQDTYLQHLSQALTHSCCFLTPSSQEILANMREYLHNMLARG
ncbi:MAG: leucyl/phenylalanyl-tRNA--protein transferase, partial [Pseudomonadota bacterium]